MISLTVDTLLSDKFSKGIFPPAYASAISAQVPVFQKFAFATGRVLAEGEGGSHDTNLCTSTSCNICTSTSTLKV